MVTLRRIWCFLPVVVLLLTGAQCHAQDQAVAQALFEDGLRAAEAKDWATACERFEESNRLDPAPGTMMNIGRCAVHLGQLARAWKSYVSATQVLPPNDFRLAHAKQQAEQLESRVPRVTLLPPETEQSFSVLVQDMEFSRGGLGVPLPFDPGPLEILVRAEGRQDAVLELELEEGARVTQQLHLGPPVVEEPAEPSQPNQVLVHDAAEASPVPDARRPAPIVASFVAGGAGVVAGVAGAVWAGIELSKVNESCNNGSCTRRGADAAKRGRIATVMGLAGAGVAVVGLSLGTALLLKRGASSLALVPAPGGTTLSFQGRF